MGCHKQLGLPLKIAFHSVTNCSLHQYLLQALENDYRKQKLRDKAELAT